MSNDVYHSITQIPTFITKTGLNLVNHYPDRFSSDQRSISSCSVESYYLEGYFGDSYEQVFDHDHNNHEIDNSNIASYDDIHQSNLKQGIATIPLDYTSDFQLQLQSQNHPSLSNHCECHCSCHSSSSNSNSTSNSSMDQVSPTRFDDPDTQKSLYIIEKIKKLILKGRNSNQILLNVDSNSNNKININDNSGLIISPQINSSSLYSNTNFDLNFNDSKNKNKNYDDSDSNSDSSNNTSDSSSNSDNEKDNNIDSISKHPKFDLSLDNNDYFKNESSNINILSHSHQPSNPKPIFSTVRKKTNIYESNNSSKCSFLFQKDKFLKTFVCSPTLSPQTAYDHFSAHYPNDSNDHIEEDDVGNNENFPLEDDDDDDDEHINVTSEEIDYLKDHPPHFHLFHTHSHNRSHSHKHKHSHCRHHSNDTYYPIYNRNLDAKTNLINIHQRYEERNISSLIDPTQSKGGGKSSDILLHQIRNRSFPNFEKIYSFTPAASSFSNRYSFEPFQKHHALSTPSIISPIKIASIDDDNHTNSSDNQKSTFKKSKKIPLTINTIETNFFNGGIKHIQNCSCNQCLDKNQNYDHIENKIPSLSKPLYKNTPQSGRTKYNIFDSIFNNNRNKNNINNNNNNNNNNNIDTSDILASPEEIDNYQNFNLHLNQDIQNALVSVSLGVGLGDDSNLPRSTSKKSLPSLTTSNINIETGREKSIPRASSSLEKIIDNENDIENKDKEEDNDRKFSFSKRPINITKYYHHIITNFIYGKQNSNNKDNDDDSYQQNINLNELNNSDKN